MTNECTVKTVKWSCPVCAKFHCWTWDKWDIYPGEITMTCDNPKCKSHSKMNMWVDKNGNGFAEPMEYDNKNEEEKVMNSSPQEPKEPEMTYRLSGEVDVVSYKDKYYFRHSFNAGDFYWYKRYIGSPNLMKVEDLEELRLVEELYDGVILDTGGVVEEAPEPEENEWKSVALRFGETLCDIGPYGYYSYSRKEWLEWVMNSFEEQASHWLKLLGKHQNLEKKYKEMNKLQDKNWNVVVKTDLKSSNWSATPYTPEQTEQSLKEAMRKAIDDGILPSREELEREAEEDIKLKNLLKAMDDYFEANKPPTLKELFEEYLTTKVDWAQSHHVTANELVDVVKNWLPSSHSSNSYEWEKCLKMLREGLR